MRRTKQVRGYMKTFKTIEEIMEFVSDTENIETLDNGEVTLKDWHEDAKSLRKYWKEHGQVTSDRKAWESHKEELTQRVAELTEQLDSVNNELAGLKEVCSGDDKEVLVQRLNAECNTAKSKIKHLETQVATIPDLKRQIDAYNRSRIIEAAKKAAVYHQVPQHIIDDPDFEKIVATDLTIDEMGNVFVKGDCLQSVYEYIAAKQSDRPHWKQDDSGDKQGQPICEYGAVSDEIAAIASLFSPGTSGGKPMQPISAGGFLSDDLIAIAALFG